MSTFNAPPSLAVLAEIIDDPPQSVRAFRRITADDLIDESALLGFLRSAYDVLDDLAGDALANAYFNRLASFVDTYNLRYELCRPCQLYPTIPGLFANLVQGLRDSNANHPHLHTLQRDFDEAFSDLSDRGGEERIKTCLQKRSTCFKPWAEITLGSTNARCRASAISSPIWPHAKVRKALKSLYGFTCDYPGIRHGGKPGRVEGNIEMRDMLALCILFIGFTPYLTGRLDVAAIFQGR
jgi:hypothetical protein